MYQLINKLKNDVEGTLLEILKQKEQEVIDLLNTCETVEDAIDELKEQSSNCCGGSIDEDNLRCGECKEHAGISTLMTRL